MNKKIDQIEAELKKLFEEKLPQLITGRSPGKALIENLVSVMSQNITTNPEGKLLAPDKITINVSTDDLPEWQLHLDFLKQLISTLQHILPQKNVNFNRPPSIIIQSDPIISIAHYSISADFSSQITPLPDTSAMPSEEGGVSEWNFSGEVYLIVNGRTQYDLTKPVVNIGRHSENNLVLTDPHISRHHAQLRAINQKYVLFDVGSTGGTFLNGTKISQATLHSGDVIRLGTTSLIFIQESTSENKTTAMPINNETIT